MTRRLVGLLVCAVAAFGQSDSPPPTAAPSPWVVDAVALDAAGRPVVDLTAEDFEIVQGGLARKIVNFTWFDTRLHVAVSRPGQAAQLPALDLLPDEIRRNVVVVVDDLGLTLEGLNAARSALRAFVGNGISSGDRMAILRSSGGSGTLEQLTGDTRVLLNAIEGVRYLGGTMSAASAGSATWLTLGYALRGLREEAGRKVVVVLTENPGAGGPRDGTAGEALPAAHAAAAAVYAINPLSAAPGGASTAHSPLESLVRDTGGASGGDFGRVLQAEQGYYAIGFQLEDSSVDPSGRWSPAAPAVLKVRRAGVVVRSRAGYLRHWPRFESLVPVEYDLLAGNALASPFFGSHIRTRLTALFSDYPAGGPTVEAILYFDPSALSSIRDLEDTYRAAVQLKVAVHTDDGRSNLTQETTHKLILRPAEYRKAVENGVRVAFQLKMPGPGGWQIRAAVVDSASDRIGSATRFVEIPDVKKGGLALSGLILRGGSPGDGAPADPREDAGMRIFKPGQNCTFMYNVFNPLTGPDKQSSLDVQTRIFAEGRVVYEGAPGRIAFGEAPEGTRRRITGQIKLDRQVATGDYILQVTVRDLQSPSGQTRTATQFIDFQVRE